MIQTPKPKRTDRSPERSRVIPFPTLRQRRRHWVLAMTMVPVGLGGLDAGWHCVQAAPVWWWQGILAVLWLGLLGIVGAVYHLLWHAGDDTPHPSDRR